VIGVTNGREFIKESYILGGGHGQRGCREAPLGISGSRRNPLAGELRMKKKSSDRFLRIPIRYVDERWECAYGGVVPVEQGTEAELIVNTISIEDRFFLSA
jgi:hypothetical protein